MPESVSLRLAQHVLTQLWWKTVRNWLLDLLERAQRRARTILRGLECFSCEDGLGELALLSLEKSRLRGHLRPFNT